MPTSINLASLLWDRATADGDSEFVLDDSASTSWSYRQLADAAAALAAQLRPGVTGVMLPNGAPMLVTAFAAWMRGNQVALLNSALSPHERDRAIVEAGITQLVTAKALATGDAQVADAEVLLAEDVPLFEPGVAASGTPNVAEAPQGTDAVLIFTSGTTGSAKAARLTHERLIQAAESMAQSLKGRPGPYPVAAPEVPPNLVAGPLAQTGGVNTLVFALVVGRRLLIIDRFSPARVLDLARKHRLDTFVGTPTMLQMLATFDGDSTWPSLRKVISGGAPLTAAVQERFERRFGVHITQVYGQTETGYIAGYSTDDVAAGLRRPGSVGRPYPGVEIVIKDPAGRPVPARTSGEVVVRTPFSMKGYAAAGADGSNQGADAEGWFETGDLGYLDEDGYLYLVGRSKELILCGGFNVYPAEIEQALLSHDSVLEAAAFGIPDERLGEVPVAAVEARTGTSTEELTSYVRTRLAHYKAPREIRIVDELPRTESNKILKRALRDDWLRSEQAGCPQ
ncbi:class I adenylate-forming enzyme family protein [Sporichthya polymorpha]|uniref:class I adenylate-forming enzyme family protein n=1 Tax=Sporichthya polymorpha TaxID=35751 RepID=UPI000364899E|nr:class I adenylate-forming enzyme family protein [Sporichthya polymorpha]